MTREQKMLAVVEAADRWEREGGVHLLVALTQSVRALRALDEHTEAQAQEMVTLVTMAVWEDTSDGEMKQYRPGSSGERWVERDGWTRLGTITLPLTPESGQ